MKSFIDEPLRFSQIVNEIFPNLRISDMENSVRMLDTWKTILSSINSRHCNTVNMADHSRVVDLKNGVLLVEVDHPGWIQMIQLHKKRILYLIHQKLPSLSVNTLAFRVKGSNAELCDVDSLYQPSEKQRMDSLKNRIEAEDKLLEKYNLKASKTDELKDDKKCSLPPELQKKFDELKKDMLTNSKK